MAQGGIKKGFFFYFGLFVLLLISVFCICLVVMMFNPGSTVLWMQYFTDNTTIHVVNTTGETPQKINWKNLENLEISCSYADVVVERNSDASIQQYSVKDANQDGIYIVNHAKGFSAASSAQHFSYQAYFKEDGTLHVEIQEPTGFLYFSKEVKVVLHATTQDIIPNEGADWNFANLNITISTKEGNVSIGGLEANNAEEIRPRSLNVSTKSGDISVTKMANLTNLTALNFQTDDGTLSSAKDVTYGEKTAKGLALPCDATFKSNGRGKISYNVIDMQDHNINLTCKSGSWDIDFLSATKILCNNCVDGNYLFGTVNGDVEFRSEDTIMSPNVRIKTLDGSFILRVNPIIGGHPDVEIGKVVKDVNMFSDKGSLKINEACGSVIAQSQNDLKVDVTLAENPTGKVSIADQKGDVRLAFLGSVPTTYRGEDENHAPIDVAGVSITTISGKVTIDLTKDADFKANMFLNDDKKGDQRTKVGDGKITINIGDDLLEGETKNPLTVGSGEGSMEIVTNGKIEFNLKEKSKLTA